METQGRVWFTRRDPYHGTYTMIDYTVASPELKVKSFGVDYTDLQTDHFLVKACVRCALKARRKRGRRRYKRYLTEKFRKGPDQKDDDVKINCYNFQANLQKAWGGLEWPVAGDGALSDEEKDQLVEQKNQGVVSLILQAVEDSVGSKICTKGFMRSWWDEEVKESIQARRNTYARLRRGEVEWREYAKARAISRRLIGRKKKADWDKLLAELPGSGKSRYMKRVWGVLNRLRAPKKAAVPTPVLLPDGGLATTFEERSEAWAEYMTELGRRQEDPSFDEGFAHAVEMEVRQQPELWKQMEAGRFAQTGAGDDSPTGSEEPLSPLPSTEESESLADSDAEAAGESSDFEEDWEGDSSYPQSSLEGPFSLAELKWAVARLKLGKAAGQDMINNEMLKAGGQVLLDMLLQYFGWLTDHGVVPREWGSAKVVALHKKGDVKDPGNYRTISLISCLAKLYLTVWAQRVSKHMEPRLGEDQGGLPSSA